MFSGGIDTQHWAALRSNRNERNETNFKHWFNRILHGGG